jgi:hypothetical protein
MPQIPQIQNSKTPDLEATDARTPFSALAPAPRPFRVKVAGSILALLRLPNRRLVRGKLHQISTTGGLLNLRLPLDEKLQLELIFHLRESTIRETVEMMFPMWATQGWMQPFRFVDLPKANKDILDRNLRALLHSPSDTSRNLTPAAKNVVYDLPAPVGKNSTPTVFK